MGWKTSLSESFSTISPFLVLPENSTTEQENSSALSEDTINRLISTVYSGPTIEDIENALSVTTQTDLPQELSQARISVLEGGLSKVENRYTLKIKSYGNAMADDGYKWRKYGQKSIKNSRNPRYVTSFDILYPF
ncbi:putative WRKY transcription factor 49 [Morella rubra]|uniref:Putative WRKY transcription factor 49 n=1 Tax=Morella rubra TaxID=262757 RepID=A0A6A1WJU9_9ROSI|nr:putative WRKY transcription factor 49 [Morella rubra]